MGREAGLRSDLTQDDVRRALVTTRDSDRVLYPLQSAYPRTLDGRLDVVAREHGRRRRRTVEIEPSALESGLHGLILSLREHLFLADASRDQRDPHQTS